MRGGKEKTRRKRERERSAAVGQHEGKLPEGYAANAAERVAEGVSWLAGWVVRDETSDVKEG